MFKFIILLSLAFFGVEAYNKCCDGLGCFKPEPPFEHHPEPQCPDEMEISTRVYTRENIEEDKGQVITRSIVPPAFKENKRTIFVVHGWMQSKDTYWLHRMKEELLKRGDFNVIITGWAGASQDLFYWRSVSNTKVAGGEIALIAQNLVNLGEIKREQTYCIGHSLGSHVCGFAGKRFKLGRISGLDPAGPLFDTYDERAGLQKTDADFVDVIHTHGKNGLILDLGTMRPLGHVDFYPNGGGGVQPGCANKLTKNEGQRDDNPDLPVCSHMRAINYFMESINSQSNKNCLFKARNQCPDKDNISEEKCPFCGDNCQVMGFDTENYEKRGLFYLETNEAEDFCRN